MKFIEIGNVKANGKVTTEGFVVLKGATVNEKTSDKSLTAGAVKLTDDILFSSSSAAADFLLGYSVSGPRTWKTIDGRALKDLEASTV